MKPILSNLEMRRVTQYEESKRLPNGSKGSVYARCVFCGKKNDEIFCITDGFIIVKCACGVTYPNPRLSKKELIEMYNKNEYSDANKSDINSYLEVEKDNENDFRRRLALIEKFVKKGKLLDVGCNIGSLMVVGKENGWKVEGIDINKEAVKIAKSKGLNARVKDINDINEISEKYDLVVMNDLIEHIEYPRRILRKVRTSLNEGGYIYIATPDGGSFMANLTKSKWLHRKPEQHLYIFPKKNLIRMLEEEGFEVLYISSIGRIRSIDVIIKKVGNYSKGLNSFLSAIIPDFIKNLSISINPSDEMHIIAKKQ